MVYDIRPKEQDQSQLPEVETRVQCSIALLLIQPAEGVFGQTVSQEPVQVTIPLDLDPNDATLW